MDLYDYKPLMQEYYDKDLPESVRAGQRLTTMTSGQKRFPIAPSKYKFEQAGKCGFWMNTQLLPQTAKQMHHLALVRRRRMARVPGLTPRFRKTLVKPNP